MNAPGRKARLRRLALWVGLPLVLLGVLVGRPAYLLGRAWLNDRPTTDPVTLGFADDASRLNRTPVREVWAVPADPAAAEQQLADLLQRARADGLKVSIAGARHSMGGHTIAPDGVVIDMLPFDRMRLDPAGPLLHAGAGARWSQVIPFLNERGLSVGVMQSNHDFSVGGSLSVNCHGWQHDRPPIASTVEAFRLMTADGRVVRCSRTENTELFGLALGGYGLFGVILDTELRVVPNARYRPAAETVPVSRYAARFGEKAADARMAYGRLCVAPGDDFLRQSILTVFRDAPCPPVDIPPLHDLGYVGLRRAVYRSQIDSGAGKEFRWRTERRLGDELGKLLVSRNQLLNERAAIYREGNADRTDVLHEYFVPGDRFADFLERARTILPRYPGADLLNVTVRTVKEDRDTVLRYADRDLFALVFLFNQGRTDAADAEMAALTRELAEAALGCGGRYYLPYRPHPTRVQFARAYPQAEQFFARKREYDPDELFWNRFYAKYGRGIE